MQEETIVRQNLMDDPNYAPYCGSNKFCDHGRPRATWDADRGQFTCRCGWASHFPPEFMTRYRAKHNK